MHSLPIFVRLKDRPVILIGQGDAAEAKRRLLERAGARVVDAGTDAAFAFVVLDGDAADRAVAHMRARGILVNAADRPDLCDFTLPAIVDRDPVLIAVGTGGASAGLAKALRQRIEGLLPAGVGRLATALGKARGAMRGRWPDAADRRRALDAALARGGALDPLDDAADARVDVWLKGEDMKGEGGEEGFRLETILLASADPDDLTLRAARLLGEADCIFHDADVAPAILQRARADARRVQGAPEPGAGLSLYLRMKR